MHDKRFLKICLKQIQWEKKFNIKFLSILLSFKVILHEGVTSTYPPKSEITVKSDCDLTPMLLGCNLWMFGFQNENVIIYTKYFWTNKGCYISSIMICILVMLHQNKTILLQSNTSLEHCKNDQIIFLYFNFTSL